ncbi:MAG: hypothetical protein QOK05_1681 [Chloroflexota bacterium]|jgi:hypothetical protein|nr:hypothetical protein [Chloroflexota bacterium]
MLASRSETRGKIDEWGAPEVIRKVTIGERRARLGRNHRLAAEARARSTTEVAESLVALHSTDPASVYLSVFARVLVPSVEEVGAALYDRREVVRMLGMRRTMFVVPRELVPVVQAGATDAVAVRMRRLYEALFQRGGVSPDPARWLREVGESVVSLLQRADELTAQELAAAEPRLRTRIMMNEGKSYGGSSNVTSMVLMLLSADGRIVRGRPLGSWISSQYRWSAMEQWLPGAPDRMSADEARTALAGRWLRAFGPATEADLRWWAGWTLRDTRAAIAGLDTIPVELDGAPGLLLAADAEPVEAPAPWVALLPALDPTPMGWSGREWYVGSHAPALFDMTGNIGPTVWADGRVIGGWAQRKDGSIAVRLLEDAGTAVATAVDQAAGALAATTAGTRVTPRFRTPIQRELSGG